MVVLNPKHELFARSVATGVAGVDAYASLFPNTKRKSATEKASQWSRRGNIRSRIAELRALITAASAQQEAALAAEVGAEIKKRYRGALMDMAERRAIVGAIARNSAVLPS